jgi:translation initiation factor 2 gamma subunit (eIF-2gamma)
MVKQLILKTEVKEKLKNDESLMLAIASLTDGKISTVIRQIKDNHINLLRYPALLTISERLDIPVSKLVEEVDGE